MFSFLKCKPAPSPIKIEDLAKFRIMQDGYGKFFVQERKNVGTFSTYWGPLIGSARIGYDKIEHAESRIQELLEYREKSQTTVVAYYV